MNRQKTLANASTFEKYKKPTKREKFLAEMERVVPWKELYALIEPFYPKAGKGRPPVGLERMLRIHFLQSWFNLSDPGAEEALYDMESLRRFVGIDLGNEPVPDETTICKFRHLLEAHGLGERIFQEVNAHLEEKGLRLSEGTIMDAAIINAPSSTKSRDKKRCPDMHSTEKGNQYSIGMKIRFGVEANFMLPSPCSLSRISPPGEEKSPHLRGAGRECRLYSYSFSMAAYSSSMPFLTW